MDLIDAAAAQAMVDRVERETGPIAVLITSAGAARRFGPEELDSAAFHQGMDAKYFSYVNVIGPVMRAMAARSAGAVVNIIGQGGKQAGVMHISGGAANAALVEFLARELGIHEDQVEILGGMSKERKLISLVGVSPSQVEARMRALAQRVIKGLADTPSVTVKTSMNPALAAGVVAAVKI